MAWPIRLAAFKQAKNVGEWMVVVQYADWMAYAKAQDIFAQGPEHRQVVTVISKIVTLIRRELAWILTSEPGIQRGQVTFSAHP